MLRSEWQFEYQASTLLQAAQKEFDRRTERMEYWKGKREEVIEQLKSKGLQITNWNDEGVTKLSVGEGIDVQFDRKLTRRLAECEKYLEKARVEKKEYAMWIQAFSECPESKAFQLNAPDIAYFGLGRSVEPDFVAPEDAEVSEETAAPSNLATTRGGTPA